MPSSCGQTCEDRKSTRLNSSHTIISYAVFCLKKKQGRRSIPPAQRRPVGRAAARPARVVRRPPPPPAPPARLERFAPAPPPSPRLFLRDTGPPDVIPLPPRPAPPR